MRVPLSWLRDYVDLPADVTVREIADRLTMLGLKLEALHAPGSDVTGPLLVGVVLDVVAEEHSNGKTIRWCQVDVGEDEPRGIVCGAANFEVGDHVVVALPGSVLPGGFEIVARKTYGHVSDGMICSARELGLGDDHTGIIVLGADEGAPGDDAAELLLLRDDVIELEINPDRAYALSLRGVAREAAAAYGVAFRDPAEAPRPVTGAGYPVRLEDADCDRFTALEVSGFDATAASPRWLARRVQLAGMRPISLAVDVTNYVMLMLGQPIHGYDKAKLSGPIVVRRARAGEAITTLDGVVRNLGGEDLLITDDSGPIGLAGVMGGASTEMSETTSDVVIEAAHFDPIAIARAARRHRLPSEASKRFERGIDPTIAPVAARLVASLLVEYGGGTIAPAATVVGEPVARESIAIDAQLPSRVSGIEIDTATAVAALREVGCEVELDEATQRLDVVPPPWRPDVTDPYDLVEEVTRIVGYDKVPSVLPDAPAGRGLTLAQRLRRRVGIALAAAGYVEALNYPFTGVSDWDGLQLPPDDVRRNAVRIANPLSETEPLLRTTLLPGLLKALARNVGRGQGEIGLFEVGAVFLPAAGERPKAPRLAVDRAPTADELGQLEAALPDQPLHVAVVVSGTRGPAGWWGDARSSSWADAVEAVRVVANAVGVQVEVAAARHAPWHPGRCAQILVGTEILGHAGELHPKVCAQYGLPTRTAAAEINLDLLLDNAAGLVDAPSFSTYPVAKEDVALIVDASVTAADVQAALTAGAGPLLESLRLFDVYTGGQVGDGRKSLAYSLRFRAPDRTLTEAEVREAVEAAVNAATTRVGAVQRT